LLAQRARARAFADRCRQLQRQRTFGAIEIEMARTLPCSSAGAVTISVEARMAQMRRRKYRQCRSVQSIIGATHNRCDKSFIGWRFSTPGSSIERWVTERKCICKSAKVAHIRHLLFSLPRRPFVVTPCNIPRLYILQFERLDILSPR
jgi:hypothetical protein